MSPEEEKGYLQDLLGQRTVDPLPSHLSWEEMKDDITERKRKDWLLFMLLPFLLLMLGNGAFFLISSSGEVVIVPEVVASKSSSSVPDSRQEKAEVLPRFTPTRLSDSIEVLEGRFGADDIDGHLDGVVGNELEELSQGAPLVFGHRYTVRDRKEGVQELLVDTIRQFEFEREVPDFQPGRGIPFKKKKDNLELSVSGGITNYGTLQDSVSRLLRTPYLRTRIRKHYASGWMLSTGIELDRTVLRSRFTSETVGPIFAPGTPDSIFVHPITREETVITTDSIPGLISRDFRDHLVISEIGLPVMIGYQRSLGRYSINGSGGLKGALAIVRKGRYATESLDVSDQSPYQRWQLRAIFRGGVSRELLPGLRLGAEIGVEYALLDSRPIAVGSGVSIGYRF